MRLWETDTVWESDSVFFGLIYYSDGIVKISKGKPGEAGKCKIYLRVHFPYLVMGLHQVTIFLAQPLKERISHHWNSIRRNQEKMTANAQAGKCNSQGTELSVDLTISLSKGCQDQSHLVILSPVSSKAYTLRLAWQLVVVLDLQVTLATVLGQTRRGTCCCY